MAEFIIPPEGSPDEVFTAGPMVCQWGVGGHENEYVVSFPVLEGDSDDYLPEDICPIVKEELGEQWFVSDRGTRLEIVPRPYGSEPDHQRIIEGLNIVFDNHIVPNHLLDESGDPVEAIVTPEALRARNLFPEYGVTEHEELVFEVYGDEKDKIDGAYSPERARKKLESKGYDSSLWQRMVKEKIGSRDERAYAIIALGNATRLINVIRANLRAVDHFDGWPAFENEIGIGPVLKDSSMHTEALKQASNRASG